MKQPTLTTKPKRVVLQWDLEYPHGIQKTNKDRFIQKAYFTTRGPMSKKVTKKFKTELIPGFPRQVEVFKNISTIEDAINIVRRRTKSKLKKAYYINEAGKKINLLKPINQ